MQAMAQGGRRRTHGRALGSYRPGPGSCRNQRDTDQHDQLDPHEQHIGSAVDRIRWLMSSQIINVESLLVKSDIRHVSGGSLSGPEHGSSCGRARSC